MIKMISFDSSTKKTGYGIFHNGVLNDYGLLDFSNEKNTEVRLSIMCKAILELLNTENPDLVYIEDSWKQANIEVSKLLTKIIGVVYAWCLTYDKEFHSVLPTQWRRYAGFNQGKKKRDELKQESIDYVKNKYNIDVNDDVADAICLGDATVNYYNGL